MDTEPLRNSTMESNGAAREPAVNGDIEANTNPTATASHQLLSVHADNGNGNLPTSVLVAAARRHRSSETYAPGNASAACRIKKELNEVVFWKVRLWMVVIFILVLMVAVTMISLALCTVIHEDADDQFDSSLFKVPRCFNGSFQMPNMVLMEDISNLSSNESQNLTAELQKKLSDVYSSSNALRRYFSRAEISASRNVSIVADYRLTFMLPEKEKESIEKFIVSREMVYNVLRQFLYDQEDDELEYIDPRTLTMYLQDV